VEHIGAFGELHGKIGDLGVSLSSFPSSSSIHLLIDTLSSSRTNIPTLPPTPRSTAISYLLAGARADDSPMNKSK